MRIANDDGILIIKFVNCAFKISNEPYDQIVEVGLKKFSFGIKGEPQALNRATGVLLTANGEVSAVCAPADAGKKP